MVFPAGYYKAGVPYKLDSNGFTFTFSHDSYKYIATPMTLATATDFLGSTVGHPLFDDDGVNEKGLAVSATNTTSYKSGSWEAGTWGVVSTDNSPGLDVRGPSMWGETTMAKVLLAECATAREALDVVAKIVPEWGMDSELFQVADKDEAWLVEAIGPHHWVATRVPDDSFAVISNSMVTDRIDLSKPDYYRACDDYLEYVAQAEEKGLAVYHEDKTLNVARTFGNKNPSNQRDVNGSYNSYRRWRGYSTFAPSLNLMPLDVNDDEVYKLYVKPDKPISPLEIMKLQRDRYEGIPFSVTLENGNVVPLDQTTSPQWFNERGGETDDAGNTEVRAIGRYSQMETHIYEVNAKYPAEIGARLWLGMSPSETSVNLPFYGNITEMHPFYTKKVTKNEYQNDSAFWLFSHTGILARSNRASYALPIKAYWMEYERKLYEEQPEVEAQLLKLYAQDPKTAEKYINDYTTSIAAKTFKKAEEIHDALVEHIKLRSGDLFVVPVDTEDKGSSSSGCNVEFGVFAIILALGSMVLLRKREF
jgi:dipeptidase